MTLVEARYVFFSVVYQQSIHAKGQVICAFCQLTAQFDVINQQSNFLNVMLASLLGLRSADFPSDSTMFHSPFVTHCYSQIFKISFQIPQ